MCVIGGGGIKFSFSLYNATDSLTPRQFPSSISWKRDLQSVPCPTVPASSSPAAPTEPAVQTLSSICPSYSSFPFPPPLPSLSWMTFLFVHSFRILLTETSDWTWRSWSRRSLLKSALESNMKRFIFVLFIIQSPNPVLPSKLAEHSIWVIFHIGGGGGSV